MPTTYFWHWLLAFAITQIIEVPIYYCFCVPKRFWVAFGASAITHPLLWGFVPDLWQNHGWTVVQMAGGWLDSPRAQDIFVTTEAELAIVVIEGLWFHALGAKNPFLWSLIGNSASCGFGLFLQATIGWP